MGLQLFTEKNYKSMLAKDEKSSFEKYYYKLRITTGFLVGAVIDQLVPCTLGLPMRLLKGFGRVLYETSIKSKFMYKVLNMKFVGSYVGGFLE